MSPSAPGVAPRYSVKRIVLASVIAAVVVALGIVAGLWQFGRYQVRADAVAASQAAQGAPVVPWQEIVINNDLPEWRTVTLTGHFDAESVTALRGRTVDREASLQYLAWFISGDRAVLVNAGWVPRDDADEITLPSGELTLEGIVRAQEPDDGKRGEGATRITAKQMTSPTTAEADLGWLMMREPCDDTGCLGTALQPVPAPPLSLGPHLSYALQWWLLAIAAPIIAVIVMRKDAQHASESTAEEAAARPRKARKHPTDEEIEDAL